MRRRKCESNLPQHLKEMNDKVALAAMKHLSFLLRQNRRWLGAASSRQHCGGSEEQDSGRGATTTKIIGSVEPHKKPPLQQRVEITSWGKGKQVTFREWPHVTPVKASPRTCFVLVF
jgi:hypothetical protein